LEVPRKNLDEKIALALAKDHEVFWGESSGNFRPRPSNPFLIGGNMALSKDLLEIIACPKCVRDPGCTGELEYREKENQLVCHHCKLIYRIEDDIPIMLIDEAIPLEKGKN
jgi:uncharacterized protein YbaR (Trm112 family)